MKKVPARKKKNHFLLNIISRLCFKQSIKRLYVLGENTG